MKLLECVLDIFVRDMVNLDSIQFGFVSGCGTVGAMSIIYCLISPMPSMPALGTQSATHVEIDGTRLGVEANFCCLGDILCTA